MSVSQLSHLIMIGRVIPPGLEPGSLPILIAGRGVASVVRTTGQPIGSFTITPDDTTGGLNEQDCTATATLADVSIAVATIRLQIIDDAGIKKLRVDMLNAANALADSGFCFAVQRVN